MKLLSLNVGKPRPFLYHDKQGYTSILKSPVEGARRVSWLNIEGDEQSDLKSHGGEFKAVYSYDIAYYHYFKKILQSDTWSYGMFGENLTTEGLTDDTVLIGNIYKVGSVYLKAIQPRFPCFKLNIRFNVDSMLKEFMQYGKHGTYFSVIQEGILQSGDTIELIETSPHKITIQQLVQAYFGRDANKEILEQILAIEFLPDGLRRAFEGLGEKE